MNKEGKKKPSNFHCAFHGDEEAIDSIKDSFIVDDCSDASGSFLNFLEPWHSKNNISRKKRWRS